MGYMIEISEGKANKLSEHIEESLKHLGKAMQCVSEMTEDGFGFGERNRPSNRYGDAMTRYDRSGGYTGYRDDDDEWDRDDMRGERRYRRRDSRGRYM